MKGLLICESTDLSANVCVTSERDMIWAFRMVFMAYIRPVSFFLCITLSELYVTVDRRIKTKQKE